KKVARSIGPNRLITAAGDSKADEEQRELIAASSLARNLEVKAIRVSNIIQLRFESTDPKLAAQVANELCRLYLERHLDMHESSGLYAFFQKQAEALRDTLQASVAALRQFEAEHGLVAPQKQRELALQQLADYETQLHTNRASAREASDQIEFLEHQLAAEPERIRSQTRNVYNSLLGALKQELDSLRIRYKASMQAAPEPPERQSPEVRNMRARIAQLEETIHHETTAPSQEISANINRSLMVLSGELSRARSKLIGYRAQEQEAVAAIDRLKIRLQEIERANLAYEALQSQWQLHQNNYLLYAKKREEARISQALDHEKIANVSIIDPASVPLLPVRPNRKLNLAMGGVLALLVSFGLTFALGYFDNSIRTSRDIERQLNIPVIVTIPEGHWRPKLTEGRVRVSISQEHL
ncbi:MAG: GumC family protein, partial [bacterium]